MTDSPWSRNEGRFDLPSSGLPGQRIRTAAPPQPEPEKVSLRRRPRR